MKLVCVDSCDVRGHMCLKGVHVVPGLSPINTGAVFSPLCVYTELLALSWSLQGIFRP